MQYRSFGSLDFKPSALGFGAMRLPVLEGDFHHRGASYDKIDLDEATRMLRHAIDQGVNYVDTAYNYHEGASEAFVAHALGDGYRDKVKVATKLPAWKVEKPADFDRYLDEQLERLQTGCIDFYLMHSLDKDAWPKVRDNGVFAWAERALGDGRIGDFGFSFHDEVEVFEEIVDASDLWSFCQIQYNYMDEENQAGTRGLEYAADKGLAVVVMEPVRGGQLAQRPPAAVAAHWAAANARRAAAGLPERSPVEWALHWVWDRPEVSLVLSGMSTMEQTRQNLAAAARSGPGALSAADHATIAAVRDAYRELTPIPCTSCRYCMPCPSGVSIPEILEIYNDAFVYDHHEMARTYYGWLDEAERAEACTQCGECEPRCPQKIAIIGWLEKSQAFLAKEGE